MKNQKNVLEKDDFPYTDARESYGFANSRESSNFQNFPEFSNFALRNEHNHQAMPFGSSYQGCYDECYSEEGFGFPPQQDFDPYYNSYEPQRSDHLNSYYGSPPENLSYEQNPPHPPCNLPQDYQCANDENDLRIDMIEKQMSLMWEAVRRLEARYSEGESSQVQPTPNALHEDEVERDEEFVFEQNEVKMEVRVLEPFSSPSPHFKQISQLPETLEEPSRKPSSNFKLPITPTPPKPSPYPHLLKPSQLHFTFPTKVKFFLLLLFE